MDYKIHIYDINTKSQTNTIESIPLKLWKFDINNTEIAYGCYTVTRYNMISSSKIAEIYNDMRYIYSICYIGDKMIATGNSNGSIHIMSLETNKKTNRIEESCLAIRSMYYDRDNSRLLYGCDDLHINIIDLEKMRVFHTLVGHGDHIHSISQAGDLYYSGSFDGSVKIWDFRLKNGLVETVTTNDCNDMAVNSDKLLVSGESNIYIFNK